MAPSLFKILTKTFIVSFILSIILTTTYYVLSTKSDATDFKDVAPLVVIGCLLINILITLFSSVGVLFSFGFGNKVIPRAITYFIIPLCILAYTLIFSDLQNGDRQVYSIIGISFLIVHTWYFIKLPSNNYSTFR